MHFFAGLLALDGMTGLAAAGTAPGIGATAGPGMLCVDADGVKDVLATCGKAAMMAAKDPLGGGQVAVEPRRTKLVCQTHARGLYGVAVQKLYRN